MTAANYTLAILGGSGLYEMDGLEDVTETRIETPYGHPSDAVIQGMLGDTRLLFLPRHGRGHRTPPHAINYRANICALKMSGATHLIAVSATGSMKEEIVPGDLVVVDQFIDLTKRRTSTFFDEDIAAHVPFADPVCDMLASSLANAAERAIESTWGPRDSSESSLLRRGPRVHRGGSYVCIEGPQFSTRAESNIYRSWGTSVIGMTSMPEAKLAREAELPFATLALATDYDCWHDAEEDVTVQAVLSVVQKNVSLSQRTIVEMARTLPDPMLSRANGALRNAIMTAPNAMTESARARLEWLVRF